MSKQLPKAIRKVARKIARAHYTKPDTRACVAYWMADAQLIRAWAGEAFAKGNRELGVVLAGDAKTVLGLVRAHRVQLLRLP